MKSNKYKIIAGVIFAILIVVIVSVKINSNQNIKIGVMAPLSGEYASAGENMVKGINLARDLYLRSHPNAKVELSIEDDGFVVAKGVSTYKKLTGIDKINALISLSTPVIDALSTEITKTDMPVMQIGIQTVNVGPDNIFQNSAAAEDGISALAKYSSEKLSIHKMALVYDTTPGGTVFYKVFKDTYSKTHDDFSLTSKDDISPTATKIIGGKYDAVVMLNSPPNGALLTKELIRLGYKSQLVYDAQLQTGFADYKRILGNTTAINGAFSIWFKDGDRVAFTEEYKKKYNEDPGFISDFGYDSFNVLMDAYSSDDKEWLSNIEHTNAIGASGKIIFDKNGVRKQDIAINKVENGEIVPVDVVEVK